MKYTCFNNPLEAYQSFFGSQAHRPCDVLEALQSRVVRQALSQLNIGATYVRPGIDNAIAIFTSDRAPYSPYDRCFRVIFPKDPGETRRDGIAQCVRDIVSEFYAVPRAALTETNHVFIYIREPKL